VLYVDGDKIRNWRSEFMKPHDAHIFEVRHKWRFIERTFSKISLHHPHVCK